MAARYKTAVFRATHNSYSGDIRGARRSIAAQLDAGVRFVEFDLYAPAAPGGDFRLGHDAPGDEVAEGSGNPGGAALRDWLGIVAGWVRARGGGGGGRGSAVPSVVTVGLDFKRSAGPLQALNDVLRDVLGGLLVSPEEFRRLAEGHADGPTLETLRGRVMVVLSGHEPSRAGYLWDVGLNPAVAVNDGGWVVEVHESTRGPAAIHDLWYWTGRVRGGSVEWMHHGKYDRGTTPAVAVNNDGLVVEVHRSGLWRTVWSRTGRLDTRTGEIRWDGGAERYDRGVEPTVAFDSLSGSAVREIHRSQNNYNDKWTRKGAAGSRGVKWEGSSKTRDAQFDKDSAKLSGDGGVLKVDAAAAASGRAAPVANTLRYSLGGTSGRIVYAELAFVEWQSGNSDALAADGVIFHANKARNVDWISRQKAAGHVVRQWAFNTAAHGTQPPSNFPATDHPHAGWYKEYCDSVGAVQY